MRKQSFLLIFLMLTLAVQPIIADTVTPNETSSNGDIISVDGYITTKFTSVGDTIEIFANTKGHSGSLANTNTIVTAEILHYPDNDPIGIFTQGDIPQFPVTIDTVVMQPLSLHEDDNSIMIWEGVYTIPINSLGGVYGASITMEEGGLSATDNPTQIPDKLTSEIEQLLQAIDDTWDSANPTMDMKAVFDNLNSSGAQAPGGGGWTEFVDDATRETGLGGSAQLWNNMILAGYDNPAYEMENGAKFLEALMAFLESTDLDAGMAFLSGLFVYGNEFPLPRTVNDFSEVAEYISSFDPIENFTRFSGTDDFSAAYDAMLGSNEWQELETALDNLADNTMVFESFQTVLRNIALLSVSIHPEALIDGFGAWVQPLADGDYDTMTPFQKLVVSWSEMDVNIVDEDGDDFPDNIIWEYELLLNTTEGIQWQAKMETDHQYIADGFDDFNMFDIELLTILRDTVENPAWENAGEALQEFGQWASNATMSRNLEWEYEYPEEDGGDDDGDEGDDDDGDEDTTESYQYVIFDELHSIRSSNLNKYVLDIGFELELNIEGGDDQDYPEKFDMTMTDSSGVVHNVELNRATWNEYFGRFTADNVGEETYDFNQPLENYRPPCADDGCIIERAELEFNTLRPSLIESMPIEVLDEVFLVSALGVIVDQDETLLVNQPYTVESVSYDAVSGAISGANVDTAILRVSPGLGASAAATFSPDGEVDYLITSTDLDAQYNGGDLDGDIIGMIKSFSGEKDFSDRYGNQHPQAAIIDAEIEITGSGNAWGASHSDYLPITGGIANVITQGSTEDGLNFQYMQQMPLPGTAGCGASSGYSSGGDSAGVGWNYREFYIWDDESESMTSYDKPELDTLTINWGDGSPEYEYQYGENGDTREDGWESHNYQNYGEYQIDITYTPVAGYSPVNHEVTYVYSIEGDDGFQQYEEESEEFYLSNEIEIGWCDLQNEQSFTPSPSIINEFITNGPFEVITQQVSTSDADGKTSLTVTPQHTGAYISIVQTEIIRPTDGETVTGLGLNFGIATAGAISVSNLDIIDYFAGLPVYAANTTEDTQSLTITTSGISDSHHKTTIGHIPLDFSDIFDDIELETEPDIQDIVFNPGETSRSVQISHSSPLSLIGIVSSQSDENGESNIDQTLTPLAVHIGLILHNPQELSLTGSLGPGQTTNIALSEEIDQATRILAVASPSQGFDPATVDFSTITELISNEAIRPATDWVGVEENIQTVCEDLDSWSYNYWDEMAQQDVTVLNIGVRHMSDESRYGGTQIQASAPDAELIEESTGMPVDHYDAPSQDGDGRYTLQYDITQMNPGSYEFSSNTDFGATVTIVIDDPNDPYDGWAYENNIEKCESQDELTDEENFEIFEEYVTRFSTIAWGQGTSADLQLPYLSSPISEYTVISIAQQGIGESATLVSAISTTLSEPNPEPPEIENLSVVFTPINPAPGEVVEVTITDEDNQPVEDLSITVVRGEETLTSLLSDENGQNSFPIPLGVITIRISGGQYYPVEINITVTEEGIDDQNGLPGDRDGDGYGDVLDAFPDDSSEWFDTDLDNIGNNADTDDDGDGILDVDELTSITQTNPLKADTDSDGYCDGEIDVNTATSLICTGGDAFPIDSSEWFDTDGDEIGDNADTDDDGDSWTDIQEVDCNNTDPLDVNSYPMDADNDGICDFLDQDNSDGPGIGDNNTNGTVDNNQQDSDSSDSTSDRMVLIGGSIGLVVILVVVGLFILMRNRAEDLVDKMFVKEEELFESVSQSTNTTPTTPPITARGEMHDGYEAIEYPAASGNWFYRDTASGKWVEWR